MDVNRLKEKFYEMLNDKIQEQSMSGKNSHAKIFKKAKDCFETAIVEMEKEYDFKKKNNDCRCSCV
jgi:hypothetical protein